MTGSGPTLAATMTPTRGPPRGTAGPGLAAAFEDNLLLPVRQASRIAAWIHFCPGRCSGTVCSMKVQDRVFSVRRGRRLGSCLVKRFISGSETSQQV